MTLTLAEVTEGVEKFLAEKEGRSASVAHIEKIFGGASRETFLLQVRHKGLSGEEVTEGLVLRRDPPTSLIDTERELEYSAYAAIYPTEIPVPEPLYLENDPKWLGQPFSLMREIRDSQTDVSLLQDSERQQIGQQKWEILGKLAALDPIELGFDKFVPVPKVNDCASRELSYWEKVINTDEIHPQPVVQAAIRWLKANLPVAAQKLSVVHGDYRSGNFLFNMDSGITAILDWEMCHLGDPLEDLAWSCDPLWCWGEPERMGKLLPYQQVVKIWEAASGLKVDEKAFAWWRLFVSIKAIAIWISSTEDFQAGESHDAILAFAGWVMTDRQNRILLDYLSPDSQHQFGRPVL